MWFSDPQIQYLQISQIVKVCIFIGLMISATFFPFLKSPKYRLFKYKVSVTVITCSLVWLGQNTSSIRPVVLFAGYVPSMAFYLDLIQIAFLLYHTHCLTCVLNGYEKLCLTKLT